MDAADNATIKNDGSLSKRVYGPGERMVMRGNLFTATVNSTNGTATAYNPLANVSALNITVYNASNSGNISNFTLNTSAEGLYSSRNDYEPGGRLITAPGVTGYYYLLMTYYDNATNISYPFKMDFSVVNQSIDDIRVYSDKTSYYTWETMVITVETVRNLGESVFAIANLSVSGNIRTSTKALVQSFNCTTGNDGKCFVSGIAAPSTLGQYILEAGNYTGVSGFRVVAYDVIIAMKDDSGTKHKNVFNPNQEGNVEVVVSFNGSTPISGVYTFTGNVTNQSGSVLQLINSTQLTSNNSYVNRFKFLLNNNFSNGNYFVHVRVADQSGNIVIRSTSFQVRDWGLNFAKAETDSGFDYEYSAFPNASVMFDIFPVERLNGTILSNLTLAAFNITLKNSLGVVLNSSNATAFNSTCGQQGCYKYSLRLPAAVGLYRLNVAVNYSDEILTAERTIAILNATMTVTPGDVEGQLKEAFGTGEFVYLTVSAKNQTQNVNVTNAKLDALLYENGTYLTYTEVSTWVNVNSSNSASEWAWNVTNQRLKLDVPKGGGNYFARVSADNGTVVGNVRFVVNPYDSCIVAKTTAGTVTSGQSYYAWQYKVSDIVYFEVKLVQANNPLGKASSTNSSTYSGYSSYGMGSGCSWDTTKRQVVTNATLTVDEVVNTQTGMKTNLNLTASTCKSDDESGGYTCTIRHSNDSWDGGRYSVKLKVLGQDGQTSDITYGLFEARAFYLWAWSSNWLNQPGSNITFTIRMYQAGNNWWSSVGSNGLSGSVKVEKIEYYGRQGEWIWPPILYDYNVTGLNETTITSGTGTLTLNISRLIGRTQWDSGSYSVVLKGTESGGNTDFGNAWFEIRNWDSYASPVELLGTSFVYKSYFAAKENITLYVRITTAGDYGWGNGGSSLVSDKSNITVTVKKIMDYSSWPGREVNKSIYNATVINVNSSSPWYSSATKAGHSAYLMNITLLSSSWNTGYYSVILDINGTETGWGWFNTIAFYVNTQPVDLSGNNRYNHKGSGPVHFLVSTTRGYKNSYLHNTTSGITDYVNTTIQDIKLNRWSDTDYSYTELKYPTDFNVTNASMITINYSRVVSLNHSSSTWPSGYYYGSMVLKNTANETATGYLWFNVQPFRVEYTTDIYTLGTTENITGLLKVLDPDWGNSTVIWGNYTVTEIYQESWSYYSRTRTPVNNFNPRNFNGSMNLSIAAPSTGWIPGWSNLVAVVYDNVTNNSKNVWIGFRAVLFSTTFGSITNQDSITTTQNVTIPVTLAAPRGGSASGNLTRIYENIWPSSYNYQFTIGNCTSVTASSCMINGTANVTIHAPATGWVEEYHYLNFELASNINLNSKSLEYPPWFRVRPAYTGSFSSYDENNVWKYHVAFTDNATLTVYAQNNSGQNQVFSITGVQYAFNPSCYSDYCRSFTSVSYTNPVNVSNNGQVIRIINPGIWSRGEHSVRVNVRGSLGTATLKMGYFYAKDNIAPNITSIVAPPYNGYKVNTTSLYFNVITNEAVLCSFMVYNYDTFYNYYCGNSNNATNTSALTGACNNTVYNGTFYHSLFYTRGGDYSNLITGGTNHSFIRPAIDTALTDQQDYGIIYQCYDDDNNWVVGYRVFELNVSNGTDVRILYLALSTTNNTYRNGSWTSFNASIEAGGGIINFTYNLYNSSNSHINSTRTGNTTTTFTWYITDTNEAYTYNVVGTAANGSNSTTTTRIITFDSLYPLIDFGSRVSGNNTMYNRTWIYANVSVTEVNEANITFSLYNASSLVNETVFSSATRAVNWTGLSNNVTGVTYRYNVTILDKATNKNSTETRFIILNASNTTAT